MKYVGIVVLLVGLLAMAGCSSTVVEEQKMPVPTDMNEPVEKTGVNAPKAAAPASGETQHVVIENFKYSPLTAEVKVGDTVEWVNRDGTAHTVTISTLNVDENLPEKATSSHTFIEKGTYEYKCRFHPGMKGKVIVS